MPSINLVSAEMGIALSAHGWTAPTTFVWNTAPRLRAESGIPLSPYVIEASHYQGDMQGIYPAPSLGELVEELPRRIWKGNDIYFLVIHAKINGWVVYYHLPENPGVHLHVCAAINSEDAAAAMWIWIQEYQKEEKLAHAAQAKKCFKPM